MPRPFVHLHLHTQYSLLDGAIKHTPLFEHAKAMNMPAVAQTDHGNLFGTVEFYNEARRNDAHSELQRWLAGDRRPNNDLRRLRDEEHA